MLADVCEIRYGLYHIEREEMLGYWESSNQGADFCNDTTVELTTGGDDPWLCDSAEQAEWTRMFEQQWYNSSIESPVCKYDPYLLRVVKVKIVKEYEFINVSIPTVYEFYRDKYAEREPRHWEMLQENIETLSPYTIYDLNEYKNR